MAEQRQRGGWQWDSKEPDPEDEHEETGEEFWSDDQLNGSGLGFTHSEAMVGILRFMLRPG